MPNEFVSKSFQRNQRCVYDKWVVKTEQESSERAREYLVVMDRVKAEENVVSKRCMKLKFERS